MNRETIVKRVGKRLQIYDGTTWKTTRAVTQTDIEEFVDDLYLYDILPYFFSELPENYRRTGTIDNWVATGTVSASSTGSTLVASSGIFTNGMVGLYVRNSTDSENRKITGFTNSTTVTVDADIDDDWDGDTIYVLGKEFGLTLSDASDIIWSIESVGVKYSDDATYFSTLTPRNKSDIYQYGGELGTQAQPSYYRTNVIVSGVDVPGIGIEPQFQEVVTKGIQFDYIILPTTWGDADNPLVPHIVLALIAGATSMGMGYMNKPREESMYDAKFERRKELAMSVYNRTRARNIRLDRSVSAMARRKI